MKTISIVMLLMLLSITLKPKIETEKTFTTISLPKKNSNDVNQNLLILTKWNIQKNNNPTLSNFVTKLTAIFCQLEGVLLTNLREALEKNNALSETFLQEASQKDEIVCHFLTTKQKFYTVKVELVKDENKTELALGLNVLERSTDGRHYTLGGKVYNTDVTVRIIDNKTSKTTESTHKNWIEVLTPKFTIRNEQTEKTNKLNFVYLEIFSLNDKYIEFLSIEEKTKKNRNLVSKIFADVLKLCDHPRLRVNNDHQIRTLLIMDYINDKYIEYGYGNKANTLLDYIETHTPTNKNLNIESDLLVENDEKSKLVFTTIVSTKLSQKTTTSDIFVGLWPKKNTQKPEYEQQNDDTNGKEVKNKPCDGDMDSNDQYKLSKTTAFGFIVLLSFLLISLITFVVIRAVKYRNLENGKRRYRTKKENNEIGNLEKENI